MNKIQDFNNQLSILTNEINKILTIDSSDKNNQNSSKKTELILKKIDEFLFLLKKKGDLHSFKNFIKDEAKEFNKDCLDFNN